MEELLKPFASHDNQVIALLSVTVIALATVVVAQWRYTNNNTVPRWIWQQLVDRLKEVLGEHQKVVTMLDDYLRRK